MGCTFSVDHVAVINCQGAVKRAGGLRKPKDVKAIPRTEARMFRDATLVTHWRLEARQRHEC